MARIIAPNREYAGVSAGVLFNGGEGHTDNAYLIGWFREHGYCVEEPEETMREGAPEITEPVAPAQKRSRKKGG